MLLQPQYQGKRKYHVYVSLTNLIKCYISICVCLLFIQYYINISVCSVLTVFYVTTITVVLCIVYIYDSDSTKMCQRNEIYIQI